MNGGAIISAFSSLFMIGWVCFIIVVICRTMKKNASSQNMRRNIISQEKVYSPAVQQYYFTHPSKKRQYNKSVHLLSKAMEDRDNDWLARQLRDEKVSKEIVSQMFALKQEHHRQCDAGIIDDGIIDEHF